MLSTSTDDPRLACCWSPAPIMVAPLLAWCRNTIEHPVSAAMASMQPITCAMGPLAFSSSMWNRRNVSRIIRRRPSAARLSASNQLDAMMLGRLPISGWISRPSATACRSSALRCAPRACRR